MYAKKELVILDDVFSGLDAETEEQIFNRLFAKNGLFQRMKTTVLLVTHAVHRLPYSNHIIALDSSGRILEQGTFDQLKVSGGYVQDLATQHKREDESPADGNVKDMMAAVSNERIISTNQDDINAQTEEIARKTGDFKVYKYYFGSIPWHWNLVFTGFIILYGVSSKFTEFIITYCEYFPLPGYHI